MARTPESSANGSVAQGAPVAPAALVGRIREILEAARAGVARTVNTTQVVANWLIGREIVEAEQRGRTRADYGARLLAGLSARLTLEIGRGWSVDNLEAFRQFYLLYPRLISETVSRKSGAARGASSETLSRTSSRVPPALATASAALATDAWRPGRLHAGLSWSHYRELLRVQRQEARDFYEIEAARNAWSVRELSRQTASLLFERLAKSRDKAGLLALARRGQEVMRPIDALRDPVVMEFLDLPESPRLVESQLEQALIDNLQHFLLELGKGFAFVARQQRLTLDGDHFYVDLVFYHTVLKCWVLIDLKVGKLTHSDLGQIQFYVNYFDRARRTPGDNPTLGLILCSDKNDAVVRYTLGEQQERNIFASRYQLHLPTAEELQRELVRERRQIAGSAALVGDRPRKASVAGKPGRAAKKPAGGTS